MKEKKIETLTPQYMNDFQCIGSLCEDTCCAGWKVTIDEETYKKYKKVKNIEMKNKLKKNVIRNRSNPTKENVAKMKMKNSKCSFLTDEGLCGVQLKLGEEYLSNTCAIYPRNIREVNGIVESSLSVSCPEAARIVLLNEDGINFENRTIEPPSRNPINTYLNTSVQSTTNWKAYFDEYRYVTIAILQSRNHTLEERLLVLGLLFNELEDCVNEKEEDKIPDILGQYMNSIEQGIYNGAFNNIQKRIEIQLSIFKELVLLRMNLGINSSRYLECSQEMIDGFGIKGTESDNILKENYELSLEKYYIPFIDKYGYALENYLVNYVFKNCMPIDTTNPFESYARMIIHYSLIKLHLIGMANYNEKLDLDIFIKLVQSLSKTFEHNSQYFNNILKLFSGNNIMDLTHMSILIKN